MTPGSLERNGLRHYWRTNVTVTAGVAIATSVLAGALVVGESVRTSLANLAFGRLGNTNGLVSAAIPFREGLASAIAGAPSSAAPEFAPMFLLEGSVAHDESGRRASRVAVYGVDDRFWRFHDVQDIQGPAGRQAFVSPGLAAELGARAGDALLVTVEAPSHIPAGVLQGRRIDRARILRVAVERVLATEAMGEFALRPTQAAVTAVFVPLRFVQRELDQPDRINAILASSADGETAAAGAEAGQSRSQQPAAGSPKPDDGSPVGARLREIVRPHVELDDLGVTLQADAKSRWINVESRTGFLSDAAATAIAETGREHGLEPLAVLSYLANTIRVGTREIPYSVVSGFDLSRYRGAVVAGASGQTAPFEARQEGGQPAGKAGPLPAIRLNEWAANDLDSRPGDRVTLRYYLWSDSGGLLTRSADFTMAGTVSMNEAGGDRFLVPEYPGLTSETRMSDWDPPFPVDLKRVRDRDEKYWDDYRTAPKAFVELEVAQRLWGTRYGRVTSVRLLLPGEGRTLPSPGVLSDALRSRIDPFQSGTLAVIPVRAEAALAARGTTDFGEYFLYFTCFLVVSALLLTGLLFRLNIEQRLRELGLLRAVGFSVRQVRRHLLREGMVLALAGSALGTLGALAWAQLVMIGLKTWWFDAVGTDRLTLHPSAQMLALGAALGVLTSILTMRRTLSSLTTLPPRTLLGALEAPSGDEMASGASPRAARRALAGAIVACGIAAALFVATLAGKIGGIAGFFGTGGLTLLAALLLVAAGWRRGTPAPVTGSGWWPVARLGFRNPRQRPGRATAAVALIASATFIVVAVGAFRRSPAAADQGRHTGTGGFALIGESVLPLLHDPGTAAGREALSLPSSDDALTRATFTRLRLRQGDDASCLSLYKPTRPRIVGVPDSIIDGDRFRFGSSMAASEGERAHPWTLLRKRFEDGAIPAIGDANSLTYVLHLGLGDTITMDRGDGVPLTLRIVGMLADSVFQSELLIAEQHFVQQFPRDEGFRVLLVESAPGTTADLTGLLEDRLSDYGLDLQETAERLANYHRVENTYISTFQVLGGLGLLLGTCGIGAMVLRGVLERRRELAVLKAVGFRRSHLSTMIVAESALIASVGAVVGTVCALIAVSPALFQDGGRMAQGSILLLPAAIVVVALLSSAAAVLAAGRLPVAATIRTE